MTARVIQGSFVCGGPRLPSPVAQPKAMPRPPGPPAPAFAGRPPVAQSKSVSRLPGPPVPAFGGRPPVAQPRPPGPPVPAFAGRQGTVQRHGSGGAFAVEAGQVGLLSGGGRPLPEAVRGKMEAALGADFSNVRVHVGPQAERIGAIAFTLGSDIYFAPGRFQPDTVQGQQLLGHELAHVVQQRAGRVRNPLGSGIAVVQDHALEAEADRLGRHAAAHRVAAQPKVMPGAVQPSSPVRISPPVSAGPGSYRLTAGAGGRQIGSVMVHTRDRGVVEVSDLGVDRSQRGYGIGQMLVASAAKTGLRFGKSKVTLAAQDKGSGHLTQWYKEMGFAQTGVNQRGYPQLEAPISRVLAGTAQRQILWRGSSTLQAMEAQQPVQVLRDLATPKVFTLPDKAIQAQDKIVAILENLVLTGNKHLIYKDLFPHNVFCLGGIELATDLNVSEKDLIKGAKLKQITPAKGVPDGYGAIKGNDKLKKLIVYSVMTTMIQAGQIEYLKSSGLTNSSEWKIVVEVHYYRDRNVKAQPGFHKDTLGETLFVNLNYLNPDVNPIFGPEYILNPAPVEEHEKILKGSLPSSFLQHLSDVRKQLSPPTETKATAIPRYGVVAFVDELIHHKSPLYNYRTVTGEELNQFLKQKFSLQYMRASLDYEKRASATSISSMSLLSLPSFWTTPKEWLADPYFIVCYRGIEMAKSEVKKYSRKDLVSLLSSEQIDELFHKYAATGFEEVSIPNPGNESIKAALPVLKRQASSQELLPEPVGARRFFRTWVRAVRRNEKL
jgi:ribosomal protein S18 acetylase RimI-like enzyme